MTFNPSVWARQVRECPPYEKGELLWLLDHWYWPFTESPLARFIIKEYGYEDPR